MSARTMASAVAAVIAHIAQEEQCRAPLDVASCTLTRARELVSIIHRVAMTSAHYACSSFYGTIKHTAHALGYRRAVTAHSPPRPARAGAPTAGTAYEKPEAACDHARPADAATITPPSQRSDGESRSPTTTDPIAAPLAPTTTTPTRGAPMMSELIEAIRVAVAEGATAQQKAIGARACRTILTALDAEHGKPIVLPGAPKPHPLAGITADQALDLVIARLTTIADAQETTTAKTETAETAAKANAATAQLERRGPRIALIPVPPRSTVARSAPQRATPPVQGKP